MFNYVMIINHYLHIYRYARRYSEINRFHKFDSVGVIARVYVAILVCRLYGNVPRVMRHLKNAKLAKTKKITYKKIFVQLFMVFLELNIYIYICISRASRQTGR